MRGSARRGQDKADIACALRGLAGVFDPVHPKCKSSTTSLYIYARTWRPLVAEVVT